MFAYHFVKKNPVKGTLTSLILSTKSHLADDYLVSEISQNSNTEYPFVFLAMDDPVMTMMGVDSSTDVQDFEEFLQDEIFVDYFNTFLSLPVRIV